MDLNNLNNSCDFEKSFLLLANFQHLDTLPPVRYKQFAGTVLRSNPKTLEFILLCWRRIILWDAQPQWFKNHVLWNFKNNVKIQQLQRRTKRLHQTIKKIKVWIYRWTRSVQKLNIDLNKKYHWVYVVKSIYHGSKRNSHIERIRPNAR